MRYFAAIMILCAAPLFAAPTVKRLLILNPVNDGGEANSYIGPSLAETLRARLAESYFFIHPPAEAIEATQKENFIQNEDLYTKSTALQMGAWLRQDLVLAGKYTVAGNRLRLNLTLYEMDGEKAILQFKTETAVTAKMFDAFNKVAGDLGEQMRQALPSQQELAQSGGSFYDPEKGKRTLLFAFGGRAVGFAKTTNNLTSDSTVSNAEFLHLNAEFTYQRHKFLEIWNARSKLPLFAQFGLNGGYAKKNYTRDSIAVPTRVIAVEALPAIGYAFVFPKLRLEPYLGVGMGYANYNFDYSGLARKPVDTSAAQSVSSQTLEQYYFFTQAGAIVKYAVSQRWAVILVPSFTLFHFSGGVQAELNAKIGAGVYF